MSSLRIATRGSDLALAQARYVAARIGAELKRETELVVLQTTGDRIQNVSLAKVGGKGLFVKEIEAALLEGSADVAVHSAKDLPAELAPGLALAAFPQREDPRDALVGRADGTTLEGLRPGARVGTGSARRAALIRALRPDFEIVPLRGNVPTRIGKLESENLDAVVLACAGLDRLGLGARASERISPDLVLPAVCQGILALEVREGEALAKDIAGLDDREASLAARAERGFLIRLGGDCTVPMAAHAEVLEGDRVRVRGLVSSADGKTVASCEIEGPSSDAASLGSRVAEDVLKAGGQGILEALAAEDSK